MEGANLFSFKGRIDLKRFWTTLLIIFAIGIVLEIAFPVSQRTVELSKSSSFSYIVPVEPITTRSWVLFSIRLLSTIPLTWALLAAIVKRLHDHERSGKWLLIILGGMVSTAALDALLSWIGAPAGIVVTVSMLWLAPFTALGAIGALEVFLFRGTRNL